MRSRPEPLALLLGLSLLSWACSDEQVPETSAGESTGDASTGEAGSTGGATTEPTVYPSLAERPCPEDSVLTSENFGAAFMLTYCTGCHHSALPDGERAGAPVGVDFESLDKVRAQADRIWARAGDQNATMPPVGPPPADERALLGEWLACGAPTRDDL